MLSIHELATTEEPTPCRSTLIKRFLALLEPELIARILLQDLIEPYRFDDDELVGNLNAAIMDTRRLCPDLLMGYFGKPLPFYQSSSMTDSVAFEQMYRMALVYHIAGYTQLQDNENVDDQRGATFMQRWAFMMLAGQT